MGIKFFNPLSAVFTNDTTGASTGCTGATPATIDAIYATWIISNPPPPVVAPTLVHALPTSNPGLTGALYLANNTLYVSQGPTGAAVQIGATGPTGVAVVI